MCGSDKKTNSVIQKVSSTWSSTQVITVLVSSLKAVYSLMSGPKCNKISSMNIFTHAQKQDWCSISRSTQMILNWNGPATVIALCLSISKCSPTWSRWEQPRQENLNLSSTMQRTGYWETGKVPRKIRLTDKLLICSQRCFIESSQEKKIYIECLKTTNSHNSSENFKPGSTVVLWFGLFMVTSPKIKPITL